LEASTRLVDESRTFLLAVIAPSKVEVREVGGKIMSQVYTKGGFYADMVVDVRALRGVAARVQDRGKEVFVERPGSFDWLDLGYEEPGEDI
jgi:hypothetical protein